MGETRCAFVQAVAAVRREEVRGGTHPAARRGGAVWRPRRTQPPGTGHPGVVTGPGLSTHGNGGLGAGEWVEARAASRRRGAPGAGAGRRRGDTVRRARALRTTGATL
eukprot:4504951-Prymnesium_polylepis.1